MTHENNLFTYATKELSQDAMLCWLINWANYTESAFFPLGFDVLNLFLGKENEVATISSLEVKRQYKKIDVLVLVNNEKALIIEDKTDTSEHSNQINRYKEMVGQEYPGYAVIVSYVKTGIIYDEDCRVKSDTIVTLDMFLSVLKKHNADTASEILSSYVEYLDTIAQYRMRTDEQLREGKFDEALKSAYGQFSFLNAVFPNRSKGTSIGKTNLADESGKKNPERYIDVIYAGANNDGTPWTQYSFWGKMYPEKLDITSNETEYQFLFWRIDCNNVSIIDKNGQLVYVPKYYLALRHYDEHTKCNDETRERKRFYYRQLRSECAMLEKKFAAEYKPVFNDIGVRENYKESDLLFIQIEKINGMTFEELKSMIRSITASIIAASDNLKTIE